MSNLTDLNICKVPDAKNGYVYKDECLYCFQTPESSDGLFICMNNFIGICKNHLELYSQKTKNILFLNLRIEKRLIVDEKVKKDDQDLNEYKKLLKEAFSYEKTDTKEYTTLVKIPYEEIKIDDSIPSHVKLSIYQILAADSLAKASERAAKAETFDPNNYLTESKYSLDLKQLDNGVKIAPTGWKCSKCDLKKNLWLNLTSGEILCGRKFADGSGGNNHAIEYYKETGYPLAVKLGTITAQTADVFSYPEDDMVLDSNLSVHLAHFGIDIMKLEKTDKTMEELEIENIKQSRERSKITESDSKLELVTGPGLTGIVNTGNSCYMNSILQALFIVPSINKFYSDRYETYKWQGTVLSDVNDFRIQLSKIGYYLKNGEYSFLPPEPAKKDGEIIRIQPGITPLLFRALVGQNHKEFATKQQQDANEFLIFILNMIEKDIMKNKDVGIKSPLESFSFKIEDRLICNITKQVNYKTRSEIVLPLTIPLDCAVNKSEIDALVKKGVPEDELPKPKIPFEAIMRNFVALNVIEDYKNGTVSHETKLETFPEYLWIQAQRFAMGADWLPYKLDVEVDMPDVINLEFMRARGLQPGEELMDVDEPKKPFIDQNIVVQLLPMGFSENACKKAAYLTKNKSVDDAVNWLMNHVGEPGFDDLPAILRSVQPTSTEMKFDENSIAMMSSMGFSRGQAIKALKETGGNLERAADWAFNHGEELQNVVDDDEMITADSCSSKFQYSDGKPDYELVGLISHIGSNTHVGHYVAHLKINDSWILFNDEKVQKSLKPPKEFAYLYLLRRCSN